MKKLILLFILLLSMSSSFATKKEEKSLQQLLERIVPEAMGKFTFSLKESGQDYFTLSGGGEKVNIEANCITSAAFGLHWYLKYYCNSTFSWCGGHIIIPEILPIASEHHETPLNQNFYLNYCTFGYTTAFWDWSRWERELDLMALNGITTPLAMVGAEVVWRNFLLKIGYNKEEALSFLSGPAHLPWLLMANMEKEGGPLPDEWFERQTELQHKIIKRMRELGMKPVYQGFFGMIPVSFKNKYSEATIVEQGKWNNVDRPSVLAPTDPLFSKMAKLWYDEYNKLFGKADYYAGDLFHEGGLTGGLNVTNCAVEVQKAMLKNNPDSKWVLQAWHANPRKELLAGLRKDRTVVLDICSEFYMPWKERNGFEGFDWVAGYVSNYGGNLGLHGRLNVVAGTVTDILRVPQAASSLKGTGAFPEGIEQNPVIFDLGNETRWRTDGFRIEDWIKQYSTYRYGEKNDNLAKAWDIFLHTAYGSFKDGRRPSVSVFCALPNLKGDKIHAFGQCKIYYDYRDYAKGVELFVEEADKFKNRSSYQYDIVDFVRQHIDNLAKEEYYRFVESYNQQDMHGFKVHSTKFLELLNDADELLSSHPMFHVATWLDIARKASDKPELKDYYEYNARLIIGTWGEEPVSIRDYAHREYGGMLKDYYMPRWKGFIDKLSKHPDIIFDNGVEISPNSTWVKKEYLDDEHRWVHAGNPYRYNIDSNPVETAVRLFRKWSRL